MRIATWNLDGPSKPRAELQIAEMRKHNAEVWVLTETNDYVHPGEGYELLATSKHKSPRRDSKSWVSVWSRFGGKTEILKADCEKTACAIISPPNRKPIIVYGTVLPWIGSSWQGKPSLKGEAFTAALAAQCAEWVELKKKHSDCEICVAGDFNQDLNERHYYGSKLGKSRLREALYSSGLECVTGGTHDPIIAAGHAPRANIDHICFSRELANKCRLPALTWPGRGNGMPYMSDHFGVSVECF